MCRWRTVLLLVALIVLLAPAGTVRAQTYSFTLDREEVDVWINRDGTVRLAYAFTFTCDLGADPIDVVDVGLPNEIRLDNVQAEANGEALSWIEPSPYVQPGVAVYLGGQAIRPGRSGTVRVWIEGVGKMLYEDGRDPNYASIEFSPTWFDGSLVHGSTELTVRFHLPPGVQPEEPRWHASPSGWPQEQPEAYIEEGRIVYRWTNPDARPDRQYIFGASFPRSYVDASAVQKAPSPVLKALEAVGRFLLNPVVIIGALVVALIVVGHRAQARRRLAYLPPEMKVEGVGIKRGLTAVEAAIVLETPLNKVLTMILFGLLKKGALTVLQGDPLRLQKNEPRPEGLYPYEQDFLAAVDDQGALQEKKLQEMMIALVKEVNNKMKGFSRKETAAYYRDIIRRAWEQVEGAQTPEVRSRLFDEGLEWTLLDDDFERRTERTFREGPVYVPTWWGHYRPWALPAGGAPTAGPVTLPGADFAAKVVRGVSDTAGRIVRSVTGFTGGVTQATNPPPRPSYSGSSRSGGGCACACACACAGCACACAGGGR
ncbi:MAG: hypothetical protein ACP5OO_01350 [Chloroflexia bacterium]